MLYSQNVMVWGLLVLAMGLPCDSVRIYIQCEACSWLPLVPHIPVLDGCARGQSALETLFLWAQTKRRRWNQSGRSNSSRSTNSFAQIAINDMSVRVLLQK